MQAKATPAAYTASSAHKPGSPAGTSLAAAHPDALYRFVPPFACDEEGYPFEDNRMPEGTPHFRLRCHLYQTAETRLALVPALKIGSDTALYFEEGNRTAVVAPDLFVAFGRTPGGIERSYKVWEEGTVPALAVEIISPSNWRKDVDAKRRLYEALRIGEYWIIDLTGRLADPITGLRLGPNGVCREIEERDSGGRLSEVLGLELLMLDGECRLRDPETGEVVPTYVEAEAARAEAQTAREAAEARVAELERRLADAERRQ